MTREGARRGLSAVAAIALGFCVTETGFALQKRQIVLTFQTQSVRPILDPGRNAAISACLPVLAVADRHWDYGFGSFLALSGLNILVWAGVIYLPLHWLYFRAGKHQRAA